MTQHMPLNKKYQLANYVLEGESFSQVAKRFEISKAGAAKIFKKMKYKVFPLLYERDKLGIDMDCIKSLRKAWSRVKGF